MPFPYRYTCDLLQRIDDEQSAKKRKKPDNTIVKEWFLEHRLRLDAPTVDASAILSTLLPQRRTDRVYGIQASRLESIIGSALTLGHSRVKELRSYKTPALGRDLGDCVEAILTRTPNPSRSEEVTVEEIDNALGVIAASCRFSSPAVRSIYRTQDQRGQNHIIGDFYARLSPRDAKWFTRLVLKNYEPVVLEEWVVLRAYHTLLPQMVKVRDDLTVATAFLEHISQSSVDAKAVVSFLKPVLGIKVGRQPWHKGRSIKHCLDMARQRRVSCEQKLDGEYCQIHIDIQKPRSIQLFSKNGKDSTQDRIGLHRAIRESLRLDKSDCAIKVGCILEGELVVYNTKENKILPFHKIRKHVARSGSYIGTNNDSQPHDYEHLMIVYYDILMIDDESLLGTKHSERFKRLEQLVNCQQGYAELVQRQVISLSRQDGASLLREAFAKCIVSRGEGLVLKPDEPYFNFATRRQSYSCCNIKLKKEYIQGWGDVGDFAVIGASYDPAKARSYQIPNLKWTHFFIGCLENKKLARARIAKPKFIVTNVVDNLSETLLSTVRTHCNPVPVSLDQNESLDLDFRGIGNEKKPMVVFLEPLVFDMRCFSFDKEPNSRFWSMRFPMVSKIHFDRSYLDTIAFDELQEAARVATETPEEEDSQQLRQWISALEKADPRGIPVDATSQETVSSEDMTPPTNREETRPPHIDLTTTDDDESQESLVLMTTPRSSAPETANVCPGNVTSSMSKNRPESQKRSRDFDTNTSENKKQRRISNADLAVPATSRSSLCETSSQPRERAPLGAIDGNSPSVETKHRVELKLKSPDQEADLPAGDVCIPSSVTGSVWTANVPPSPPNDRPSSRGHQEDDVALAHPNHELQQPVTCAHRGDECQFVNKAFLLSPCISQYPWVTENLLRAHGIMSFATEPETWSQELTLQASSTTDSIKSSMLAGRATPPRSSKKTRIRKICLVDTRRPEAAAAFMRRIEKAGFKQRNGKREWISVYDWRILEDIANIESGFQRSKGQDPWRSRQVGLA